MDIYHKLNNFNTKYSIKIINKTQRNNKGSDNLSRTMSNRLKY